MSPQKRLPPREPLGWSHWRAALMKLPELAAWEFGFYTDVWVTDEVQTELGPLQILNPIASAMGGGGPTMAIIARFGAHRPDDPPGPVPLRTNYSRYLAVDVGEEVAALVVARAWHPLPIRRIDTRVPD